MNGSGPGSCFVLKVDVDTQRGLRDGTPRLLDLLDRHGVRASWFVAMGPDNSGRVALRLLRQRGFAAKMLRTRAPMIYPWTTMLRGTLLPSIPVVESQPDRLRAIAARGHEVGIHGHDHVRWHDKLLELGPRDVELELTQACALFRQVMGRPADAFAAPGWQCTRISLDVVDRLGFRMRSDTRGVAPYRPLADGYLGQIPEIPTTLPTLDEVLGFGQRSADEIADDYLKQMALPGAGVHVHTIHAEIEGGPYTAHLDALLRRVKDLMPVRTLGEVASRLGPVEQLPVARVEMRCLPGRAGRVAVQSGGVAAAAVAQ